LKVECHHYASPNYYFETQVLKKAKGMEILKASINATKVSIESQGGTLEIPNDKEVFCY
jgi:translation initiation factor 2 alpha subunit (eIF-2alpha)